MEKLFNWGDTTSGLAPVMLYHLWGALDAGEAGQMTVNQIAATLKTTRVATFDVDSLIDFRSRRPIVSMEDWCLTDVEGPVLVVDMVTDYDNQHFLMLHGPEPDFQWNNFVEAVAYIAKQFGVTKAVNVMGMPAGVPHTRSTFVHCTATDRDDVPDQPGQGIQVRMTSSMNTFLQLRLGRLGMASFGLVAGVPYYLSDMEFPQSSVALMDKVRTLTGLNLPVGDLEASASHVRVALDKNMEESEDMRHLVRAMEERFDTIMKEEPPVAGFLHEQPLTDSNVSGDVLAAQIEQFLRHRPGPFYSEVGSPKNPPHFLSPELFGDVSEIAAEDPGSVRFAAKRRPVEGEEGEVPGSGHRGFEKRRFVHRGGTVPRDDGPEGESDSISSRDGDSGASDDAPAAGFREAIRRRFESRKSMRNRENSDE